MGTSKSRVNAVKSMIYRGETTIGGIQSMMDDRKSIMDEVKSII